jgi:K+-sensing histidine kinase KdpD
VSSRPSDTGLAIGYAVAGLGPILVAGALVGIRSEINNTNVALVLVVVVVVAAAAGGRGAAALAAVVATLSFDFFQTRPYLRLTIDSRDDIETTIVLLAIGLLVGEIVVRARRSQAEAARGRDEIGALRRVAAQIARGAHADVLQNLVCDELTKLLDLAGCGYEPASQPGAPLPRLERSGTIDSTIHHMAGGEFTLPPEGAELPVMGRGRELGRLVLHPQPHAGVSLEQRIVAVALADQFGAALASDHTLNGA